MISTGTANSTLEPSRIGPAALDAITGASYLYLSGLFKISQLYELIRDELIPHARSEGTVVVVDHGRVPAAADHEARTMVRELVEQADIYLPSKREFLTLWEEGSVGAASRRARRRFEGIIVVKDSDRGAAICPADGEPRLIPPFDVSQETSIGAGDSFNAGLVAAHGSGLQLRECVEFACATGALRVAGGIPDAEAVVELCGRQSCRSLRR